MSVSKEFLPFALPEIGEEEIAEVVDCLRSGWLTTGPRTKRFEAAFADYVGVKHAIAVNSGTAALHLALEAMGIGPGDKVATTPFTFTASAEIIRYLEADPVFVDIDPVTLNLDPDLLEEALKRDSSIKAIIPVHIAGQACDMSRILELAGRYGLKVLEDAAHALPATHEGRLIGSLSHATAFSFYVTKPLAVGEGGMVVTDDQAMAERMRTMRLHGINRDIWDRYTSDQPKWYYEVVAPGFKYNMPDVTAAIGIHQLAKVDRFHKKRQAIADRYTQALAGLPLRTPQVWRPEDRHAWHLYIIQLELEHLSIDRDEFIRLMSEQGIGTSVHFIPLHLMPYWRERYDLKPEDFPTALDCYRRVVSLPIYTRMTGEDVERVIRAVGDILTRQA